jgi:hypothetical protein
MTEGSLIEVIEERDGWVRLSEEFKEMTGWMRIRGDDARPLLNRESHTHPATTLWRVVFLIVNVRDEPQLSARVVSQRRINSLVEVSRREGGWVQLVDMSGVSSGWMLIAEEKRRLLEPFRPFTAPGFTPRSWARISEHPTGALWRVVRCQAGTGPGAHAKVHRQPRADAAEVRQRVGEGSLVEVTDRIGAWIRLGERPDGTEAGWILTEDDKLGTLVQRMEPQPRDGLWRVTRLVNVRAAPSTSAKVLARAYEGSYVHSDLESSGWVRLVHRFSDVSDGFTSSSTRCSGVGASEGWMLIATPEDGTLLLPCPNNLIPSDFA